jgi:hypothetical protein
MSQKDLRRYKTLLETYHDIIWRPFWDAVKLAPIAAEMASLVRTQADSDQVQKPQIEARDKSYQRGWR